MSGEKLKFFKPSDFQIDLEGKEGFFNLEEHEDKDKKGEDEESLSFDVLFVGGGPSGLAGAIELSRLVKKNEKTLGEVRIGVVEKASRLGAHSLSGAVINPSSLMELFPDLDKGDFPFCGGEVKKEKFYFLSSTRAYPLPLPPTMKNKSYYALSLSELVRWMGEQAQEMGVDILTSFTAQSLLVKKSQVVGVRSKAYGLNKENLASLNYDPPLNVYSKVTILAEGSRGFLTELYLKKERINLDSPQIYSLGVKEVWRTKNELKEVIHTMNWPLPSQAFGGSFVYPMGKNRVSLGMVVGLDAPYKNLNVHNLLQEFKTHPLVKKILKDGEVQEWGAKTIPEGGFYSVPKRLSGDGVLIIGDSAGLVDVPSLKGIHYAIQSGIYAARSIFRALKLKNYSRDVLKSYDKMLRQSYVISDLKRTRNVRRAFKEGLYVGGLKAALMILTRGFFPNSKCEPVSDAKVSRSKFLKYSRFEKALRDKSPFVFSKLKGVYLSKNKTRDDVPNHLRLLIKSLPPDVQDFYESLCPAQVYERKGNQFIINPSNCIDCKATDILGPRWCPREGGSGSEYHFM